MSPNAVSWAVHSSMTAVSEPNLLGFADNMKAVGLINNNDETTHKDEVKQLIRWCHYNNLSVFTQTKDTGVNLEWGQQHKVLGYDHHRQPQLNSQCSIKKKAQQCLQIWNRLKTHTTISHSHYLFPFSLPSTVVLWRTSRLIIVVQSLHSNWKQGPETQKIIRIVPPSIKDIYQRYWQRASAKMKDAP